MVTAHKANGFMSNEATGDTWNMYNWQRIFNGYHYGYDSLKDKSPSELDKYDIAILSGHPAHLDELTRLAEGTKAVTVFFPEGDISLYHDKAVYPETYMAWNACSIVGIVEEDKIPFYSALTHRPVRFLHVPVPNHLLGGAYFAGNKLKNDDILVYGDNNPNNPIIAFAVARVMGIPLACVEIPENTVEFIKSYFGIKVTRHCGKMSQDDFLKLWMAPSRISIYPTRWIGTARQCISAAICGTPIIGTRDSHTQRRLFPELCAYNYDTETICKMVHRLYSDEKFYNDCRNYAFHNALFYGETEAVKRMIEAYETAKAKKSGAR